MNGTANVDKGFSLAGWCLVGANVGVIALNYTFQSGVLSGIDVLFYSIPLLVLLFIGSAILSAGVACFLWGGLPTDKDALLYPVYVLMLLVYALLAAIHGPPWCW